MFDQETRELLQKNLPVIPAVIGGASLKSDIDELVKMVLPRMKLAVVDDRRTAEAFGDQIFRALKGATRVTLDGIPTADKKTVDYVRSKTMSCDALVAVGSGTISDICKYAAAEERKPYVVFPTAASMNGYLSANASIAVDGYKKTMAAAMPLAVFCDFSVIAAAPARLTKSGFGDSLARPTAQADWLLSHLLLGTAYNEVPFALLKNVEPHLFEHARGIAHGDRPTIELLMQLLLLSGLGMTIAGGSYPASQGEHMIAHAYEMLIHAKHGIGGAAVTGDLSTFHGEQIGVTTLAMARRQEVLIDIEPELLADNFNAQHMTETYGEHTARDAKKAFAEKRQKIDKKLKPSALKEWDKIAERIVKIMLSPARIELLLQQAEAPTSHHQLGWNDNDYMAASSTARFLRERFTFLDLT